MRGFPPRHGTRRNRIDHRDFDFHRSFGSVVPPSFPDTYNTESDIEMPDQNHEGLPYGCTDETQKQLANDIAKVVKYTAQELEAVTHANFLGGYAIRDSLSAARSLGWINAYFNIQAVQADYFDAIRMAMMYGAPEQRSVSIGTPWYAEFEDAQYDANGIVVAPASYSPAGLPWHNWAIVGWKQVNGKPYLIGKSWQGPNFGAHGYHLVPREIINSIMTVKGTVAFTASNMKPGNVQTISVTYLQWLMSYVRTFLDY